MAQEYRLTADGFYGQLASQLTAAATTHTDAAWAGLPTWTGTAAYMPLTLTSPGLTEIVWVTVHASGTPTQVTLLRAKEGTTARTWPTGTQFAQADMRRDGLVAQDSSVSTTDFHWGSQWIETNTGLIKRKTGTGIVAAAGVSLPSEVGPTRSGSNPPAGATIQKRSGNTTCNTNGSGDGTVNFRVAFPTACQSVVVTGGDPGVFAGVIHVQGEAFDGFNIRAINLNGTAFASSTVRLHYDATGW